jgi:cytochrome oxidase assembly protein ShyY1
VHLHAEPDPAAGPSDEQQIREHLSGQAQWPFGVDLHVAADRRRWGRMVGIMYRFMFRPRWIAGHVLVIVTVVAFVNLGLWQLRRFEERRTGNALITARLAAPAQPLDAVLAEADQVVDLARFRRVEVAGTFAKTQLLTAPRSVEGRPGHQVLGVLERDGRPAVLVDRGWIPFDRASQPPPVPEGTVAITGVARAPEPGDLGASDQVARIAPAPIAERLDRTLTPVYVQAADQRPRASAGTLRPTPLPELTEGNHRSYAVQWFSFAAIVLIGYPVLLWRTGQRTAAVTDAAASGPSARALTAPPLGSRR